MYEYTVQNSKSCPNHLGKCDDTPLYNQPEKEDSLLHTAENGAAAKSVNVNYQSFCVNMIDSMINLFCNLDKT